MPQQRYYTPAKFGAAMLSGLAPYITGGTKRSLSSTGTVTKKKRPARGNSNSLKNKIRELESVQHYSTDDSTLSQAMVHNTFYTHCPTAQITQGDANFSRTGDQIYLVAIKLNGFYGTSTSLTNGQKFRIVLFYSDVFNNAGAGGWTSTLSINDVRMLNTGSQYTANVIFDPKKVTVIYDETHQINQQIASVSDVSQVKDTIQLNRSFPYHPSLAGQGTNRNLYIAVFASSSGGTSGVTATGTFYLSYDLLFKNSK